MHDLLIIGGGPAGTAAAVYAARKRLASVLVTKEWGGQSNVSLDVQNWIGTVSLSGDELAKNFKAHVEAYKDDVVEVREYRTVERVERRDGGGFVAVLDNGDEIAARAVLVATGSNRRRLPAKGADQYEHKGLTYCASCDGPMFSDQDVAVIGGGNAGFETAAQLLAYCKSVTLFERSDSFNADPVTVEQVSKDPKFRAMKNTEVLEVTGEQMVTGMRIRDITTETEQDFEVAGIFVEIGMIPATGFVADVVSLDEYNRIPIDPWTQRTQIEGLWAAGDCTDVRYHQNNIAAGDAVRALEDIYIELKRSG